MARQILNQHLKLNGTISIRLLEEKLELHFHSFISFPLYISSENQLGRKKEERFTINPKDYDNYGEKATEPFRQTWIEI